MRRLGGDGDTTKGIVDGLLFGGEGRKGGPLGGGLGREKQIRGFEKSKYFFIFLKNY